MRLSNFILLIIFSLLLFGTMADSEDSCSTPWEESFTLPPDVIPSHYDLYMHPDLSTKTFSGSVDIKIYCAESRDHLIVHTKWLNITDTKVHRRDGGIPEEIPILETFEYKPNEFWIIKLLGVDEGYYTITLDFEGSLTNGILGFYYSEYTDEMGINRGLATTKFEPTYARRAFPCFDEPGWRTTYNITVVRPSEGYIALSNMPIEEELVDTPEPGLTEVVFEKAVPMVTYLVCFIVCDFTYKEIIMEDTDIPFRVYAPPGRIDNAKYALDTGVEVLMYYEDIFDSTFPLPKCDMAAIPDYSSGATEHWGIITFRETSIFYNANQSSAVNKQRVTSVIAHELAHQWFGNLVTMKWWDDLWLNEGFASYMEFKGVNSVYPTWQMDSQFPIVNLQSVFIDDSLISSHPIIQPVENNDDINAIFNSIAYDKDAQFQCKSLQRVMVIDGGLCSHPIVQKVGNNDQINAMFDAISYLKGSSVLRMLEDFMGQYFQAGIVAFLKKYEYSNAITQDLWNELTNSWEGHHPVEEKGDVGAIMDTWTRQMGYPVVNVRRTSANSFNLTQTRFLQDPTAEYDPSESDYGYKWDIPVSYLTSAQTEVQRDWLYMHMPSLELKFPSDVLWIKVNMKQKGFYRVNYDASVWRALEGLCIDKVLDVPERSSLLNDAIALADAALLDYNTALNMTRILATERDYIPWDAAFGQLVLLQKRLLGTAASDLFNKYVSYLAEPVYSELGWEDTGEHLQKLLRNDIVTIACASGSTVCLQAAGSQLKSWIIDGKFPLPLGTRREIYRWGTIYEGSQETWDVMWQRALAEQSATETDNLYYGMANVQNTVILARYIELAQDEKNVRSQNFLHILQYISSNPAGSDFVWAWVRSNWEWLVGRYTLNDRYLGQLIPNICKYFTTESKLSEMEAFFAKYPDAGAGELNRQQALETVRFNIRWVKDNAQTILDWLSTQ